MIVRISGSWNVLRSEYATHTNLSPNKTHRVALIVFTGLDLDVNFGYFLRLYFYKSSQSLVKDYKMEGLLLFDSFLK